MTSCGSPYLIKWLMWCGTTPAILCGNDILTLFQKKLTLESSAPQTEVRKSPSSLKYKGYPLIFFFNSKSYRSHIYLSLSQLSDVLDVRYKLLSGAKFLRIGPNSSSLTVKQVHKGHLFNIKTVIGVRTQHMMICSLIICCLFLGRWRCR